MGKFKYDFEHDLDHPARTVAHREIIRNKAYLRKTYLNWYKELLDRRAVLPPGKMLEIGSGGGFLEELIPDLITSDILDLPHCDMKFSAEEIPMPDNSLSAIFMVNVLHHIPRPVNFFSEAQRLLKPDGLLIMVEPANTMMSRFIYKRFHHEAFDEKSGWELSGSGPMSDSNQAMPWIILHRDRKEFLEKFPSLEIVSARTHTPFTYIVSGGVSRNNLLPDFTFGFVRGIEVFLGFLNPWIGLFETYILKKGYNR